MQSLNVNYLLSTVSLNPINRMIIFEDKTKAQLIKLRLPLLINNNEDHKASFTLSFYSMSGAGLLLFLQKRRHRSTFRTVSDRATLFPPSSFQPQRLCPFCYHDIYNIISLAIIVSHPVPHGSTNLAFFGRFLKNFFERFFKVRFFGIF